MELLWNMYLTGIFGMAGSADYLKLVLSHRFFVGHLNGVVLRHRR